MSESKTVSVFDGAKYLYAEQLGGKAFTLTIKTFEPTTIIGENGRSDRGFEVGFIETPKKYAFACVTNRRALAQIFGTEDYTAYIGKRVRLFAAKTGRGMGIRFAADEGGQG